MNPDLFHNTTRKMPTFVAKPDSDVEWWFVQGWVEGPDTPRTYLMSSLFHMRAGTPGAERGAMLLQHAFDTSSAGHWTDSRVTPATVSSESSLARRLAASAFPGPLQDMAIRRHNEVNAIWMRRAGIVIDQTPPVISDDPFTVAWNGFGLEQTPEGLIYRAKRDYHTQADLRLTAIAPWLDEHSRTLHPSVTELDPGYAYVSCPRLAAEGTLGGAEVTGEFWIDRQWGGFDGWILQTKGDDCSLLGWHWFGLQLDDGRELLLDGRIDPVKKKMGARWGIVFENGTARSAGRVELRSTRTWISPKSGAHYPVDWEVSLPDLDMTLTVRPVRDDQEIPVYGMAAIWEGAAQVTGTSGGVPISGTGRLELNGYGKPLSVQEDLRNMLSRSVYGLAETLNVPLPRLPGFFSRT